MVFLVASVIVLAGAVVALVLGRGGASTHLSKAASTAGGSLLPEGPLTGADARSLRFDTGFRGYRTDEVDAALHALADRIAELEGRVGAGRSHVTGVMDEHPGAHPGEPGARRAPEERSRTIRGPWARPVVAADSDESPGRGPDAG